MTSPVTRTPAAPVVPDDPRLRRLRRFAYWLDAGIPLPFTSFRVGLDPVLGLVPGLGDAAGALLAAWILYEGYRLGASRATLARIAGNVAVDALTGTVPLAGDAFDAVWKVNLRNIALLERHASEPARARAADRRLVFGLMAAVVALGVAVAIGGVLLGVALLRAILP